MNKFLALCQSTIKNVIGSVFRGTNSRIVVRYFEGKSGEIPVSFVGEDLIPLWSEIAPQMIAFIEGEIEHSAFALQSLYINSRPDFLSSPKLEAVLSDDIVLVEHSQFGDSPINFKRIEAQQRRAYKYEKQIAQLLPQEQSMKVFMPIGSAYPQLRFYDESGKEIHRFHLAYTDEDWKATLLEEYQEYSDKQQPIA